MEIKDKDTFVRPIYAGNAIATVKSSDATKLMTIRASSFEAAAEAEGSAEVDQQAAAEAGSAERTRLPLTSSGYARS